MGGVGFLLFVDVGQRGFRMKKFDDNGKLKFAFTDEDDALRSAFETAMSKQNHQKQMIAFMIENARKDTEEADHQWSMVRKHLKEHFPEDWPNRDCTIQYSHPDGAFSIDPAKERPGASRSNNRGTK